MLTVVRNQGQVLKQRHCGDIGLFCGDVNLKLFCGDVGLFCGVMGLFCGDVGLRTIQQTLAL